MEEDNIFGDILSSSEDSSKRRSEITRRIVKVLPISSDHAPKKTGEKLSEDSDAVKESIPAPTKSTARKPSRRKIQEIVLGKTSVASELIDESEIVDRTEKSRVVYPEPGNPPTMASLAKKVQADWRELIHTIAVSNMKELSDIMLPTTGLTAEFAPYKNVHFIMVAGEDRWYSQPGTVIRWHDRRTDGVREGTVVSSDYISSCVVCVDGKKYVTLSDDKIHTFYKLVCPEYLFLVRKMRELEDVISKLIASRREKF